MAGDAYYGTLPSVIEVGDTWARINVTDSYIGSYEYVCALTEEEINGGATEIEGVIHTKINSSSKEITLSGLKPLTIYHLIISDGIIYSSAHYQRAESFTTKKSNYTYLVIKSNENKTLSYTCKTSNQAFNTYLKVYKNNYLGLTTQTAAGINLKIKMDGKVYRPVQSYTTTSRGTVATTVSVTTLKQINKTSTTGYSNGNTYVSTTGYSGRSTYNTTTGYSGYQTQSDSFYSYYSTYNAQVERTSSSNCTDYKPFYDNFISTRSGTQRVQNGTETYAATTRTIYTGYVTTGGYIKYYKGGSLTNSATRGRGEYTATSGSPNNGVSSRTQDSTQSIGGMLYVTNTAYYSTYGINAASYKTGAKTLTNYSTRTTASGYRTNTYTTYGNYGYYGTSTGPRGTYTYMTTIYSTRTSSAAAGALVSTTALTRTSSSYKTSTAVGNLRTTTALVGTKTSYSTALTSGSIASLVIPLTKTYTTMESTTTKESTTQSSIIITID